MKVSAIIRCKNEEEWIGHAIQSFIDFFPHSEIIIINNNSTDASIDIVKLFDRYDITIVNIDDYTPGKAINVGVSLAKYENILIQSAHTVIKKINLKQVKLSLDKYAAVFGNQIPIYKGKRITKRYIWSHFKDNHLEENMFSNIEDRLFLHNAFCFYNKRDLLRNKFDERLHGKEDRYWAISAVEKGSKFLYDSVNLESYHYYTTNGATWKGLG